MIEYITKIFGGKENSDVDKDLLSESRKQDVEIDKIKECIQEGARVNCNNNEGMAPLHLVCKWSGDFEAVKLLVSSGANIHLQGLSGMTPLHYISWRGGHSDQPVKIVKFLIDRGANVNKRDHHGATPLHWSAGGKTPKSKQITRILLSKGAQVDIKGRNQKTPLHWAADRGNYDQVEMLLNHGSAVNDKCYYSKSGYYTPLFLAVKSGAKETVRILVEHGADPYETMENSSSGESPLSHAYIEEKEEIIDIIK